MKVLCLNLPHQAGRLQRRFVASYYAPNFLVPPVELMGLAAIVTHWKAGQAIVLDAIAEELDLGGVIDRIGGLAPDLIVALSGFSCFTEDMGYLDQLKQRFPETQVTAFGYLPSQRPEEVMANTRLDALFCDEPELPFSGYLDVLAGTAEAGAVPGLASRHADQVVIGPKAARLNELDDLPFPDYSQINLDHYSESYLGRPIAAVLSARGCPYQCTYCVRMYGQKFVTRSAENILDELSELAGAGIRNIRFMDDTFTLAPERLKAICQGMLDRELNLRWTCLTRLDCLDDEGLSLMKRSGCKRMYCGVERGSQRLLDQYKKGACVETMERQIKLARSHRIEVSAFFIVGAPGETDEDFEQSVQFALRTGLDYVIVTRLQYWPGTELYSEVTRDLDFSLFPFKMAYAGDGELDFFRREKEFYRRFYMRPSYALRRIPHLLRTPKDITRGFVELARYVGGRRELEKDFI